VYGVTGIVTKPIQKTREEGAKGFFKGLGSGLVGAIAAPVTATLRAGTSVTQGVAASANSLGMIGKKIVDTSSIQVRFRPPRYISAKGVIQEYDEDLALVRQILVTKYSGIYAGDSIKFYSLLPYTKKNGVIANSDSSSSMIIITETMFLYFRLDTSDKKRG
jgi:vacuolar protein sorting-associated protein 13A/C